MKFDCPYCGKEYDAEGAENADILFRCNACNKFVGIFQKIELARKIEKWIQAIKAVKYFFLIAFIVLIVLNFFSRNASLDNFIYCIVALASSDVIINVIIYRFSALSFQVQKEYEQVELQKYLIGQIKK